MGFSYFTLVSLVFHLQDSTLTRPYYAKLLLFMSCDLAPEKDPAYAQSSWHDGSFG